MRMSPLEFRDLLKCQFSGVGNGSGIQTERLRLVKVGSGCEISISSRRLRLEEICIDSARAGPGGIPISGIFCHLQHLLLPLISL
jgi:hypothetical protein